MIRAVGDHRREGVEHRDRARERMDVFTGEAIRISAAIPPFVMLADDVGDFFISGVRR